MLLDPDLLNRVAPLEVKARSIVEGFISGLHRSPYHGFSVEFAEHRPYNRGDEIRHIDWKVVGKTERFYVKQYEEETNLRAHVVLDTSSSMNFRHFADWSKLRYSIHFAAALLYMMNRQRDACGLVLFDEEIRQQLPARSSITHLRRLFAELELELHNETYATRERKVSASAEALHLLAERLDKRSLVILLTDLFENVQDQEALISALRHLKHERHEVLLFNVLERRSERDLDFPGGMIRLEDMETGGELDLIPAQVREEYRRRVESYTREFRIACSESRIDFEEIDTESPFDLALLAWLNKRKRMG
ncbi:MAG: DUF58 domain-containing protein [Balneolaceae bacterium]